MNKPTKRRFTAADLQLQLSEVPIETRQTGILNKLTPEDLIHSMIRRSTTFEALNRVFTNAFPDQNLDDWLEADKDIKHKHVQGLGNFLFYSSPGKMDFHEHLLDIVLTTLKRKRIQTRRGSKRKGADFFIIKQGKKTYCEIETGLFNRSEHRPNLEARIRRYPDRCVILVCNQVDKKRYLRSDLRFQANREPIIMTIWEFLNGGAWRKRFLEVNVRWND